MKNFKFSTLIPCAILALTLVTFPVEAGPYSNNASVKVKNAATSDGTISFGFSPKPGSSETINVYVEDGWSERRIAQEIQEVFNSALGANYRVTWNGKRTVSISKRKKKKKFHLSSRGSTATGVTVRVK